VAAAERALVYVRGTHDQSLLYYDPGAENRNVLTGWVDGDFAADSDTRHSVTGYVMALNGAPNTWRSFRQGGVTLSSSETEYVAAPSPRRTPTSALFYQVSTVPLLVPHAFGKTTLHVFL